jgi:hypothetical protein
MEPEQTNPAMESQDKFESLKKVTSLSKYLAMLLFIIMPFIGGWIGYTYAPVKIVEIEKIVTVEKIAQIERETVTGFEKYIEDIVLAGLTSESESPLEAKKVFLSEGTLYVLRFTPMGEGLSLTPVTWYNTPPNEFRYIGGDYINDGTSVIFLGNRFSKPMLVSNADISTFRTISPTPKNGGVSQDIFGLDSKAVYYDGKILDGVDPESVNFESHPNFVMPVVFDEDTYWYPEGGCDGADYRSGTKEELETYVFPC